MSDLADLYAAASPEWHGNLGTIYVGDHPIIQAMGGYNWGTAKANIRLAVVLHRCGLEMHEALENLTTVSEEVEGFSPAADDDEQAYQVRIMGTFRDDIEDAKKALASVAEALKGNGRGI